VSSSKPYSFSRLVTISMHTIPIFLYLSSFPFSLVIYLTTFSVTSSRPTMFFRRRFSRSTPTKASAEQTYCQRTKGPSVLVI
jgi:hypothetical protein